MRHRKLHYAVLFAAACPTVAEPPTLKVQRQEFMDLPDEMHVLGLQHLPNQRELAVFVPKGYVLINLETNQLGPIQPTSGVARFGENATLFARGGGFSEVGPINRNGQFAWSLSGGYSGKLTANGMSVVDLDENGTEEYYVATDDGIHRYDRSGSRVWKKLPGTDIGNLSAFAGADDDGRWLAASASSGNEWRLFRFNGDGDILNEITMPESVADLQIVVREPQTRPMIAALSMHKLRVLRPDGFMLFSVPIPKECFQLCAETITGPDGNCLLAFEASSSRRRYLFITTLEGDVLIRQSLDCGPRGLAVIPFDDGEAIVLADQHRDKLERITLHAPD